MAKRKTIPAISIIIPMYNTEKYISECLESILAQTFENYEVIVVDDCSTDNSAAIVESYIPKFRRGGVDRLNLLKLKVNSGGAGKPRNKGLRFALGEYVFFMDSDDSMMRDGFEKLYRAAEKYDADVIHCDKCYQTEDENIPTDKSTLKERVRNAEIISSPTYMPDDPVERVKKFMECKFSWEPWNHLIRRTLLIENDIKFSNLSIVDDSLFSFFVMCMAEKIICLPEAFYIWRNRTDSNSREILDVAKTVHRRAGDIFKLINHLEKFCNEFEPFKENMEYRYAIFDFFREVGGNPQMLELYSKIPAHLLDGLVRKEIEQIEEKDALTAFLFSKMIALNLGILQLQGYIQQMQTQNQKTNENIF